MPDVTLIQIKDFFGYTNLTEFSKDWKAMPTADRDDIKKGLSDGALSY